MCEIFGINARRPVLANIYLSEFFRHSNEHPDGWGLARLTHHEPIIEKEPVKALKSSYLKSRLSASIEEQNLFAHIRYATIGNVDYKNCHPFTRKDSSGRCWTLNHNGTIFEFPPLEKYSMLQNGTTDSERILMYLVDEIDRQQKLLGHVLTKEERFELIDSIVCELAKENNKLNFLLFDGDVMYVHTNCRKTLHYHEFEDGVIFSTQPLGGGRWEQVPFTTLLAYQKGKRLFTGTEHGHEHIYNEEDMKYIYQIFANL